MATDPSPIQHAQIAAILGPDSSQFETLIDHLMSLTNEQRLQAEKLFKICKKNHPDALSIKLAQMLHDSPRPEARAMSAILLRKQLTRDDSFIWPRLADSTRANIKSVLLNCFQREDNKTITRNLCDAISELALVILPDNGWPELLPFMFHCLNSDNSRLQASALMIFARLGHYLGLTLSPHLTALHSLFLKCLGPANRFDVRIGAFGASINFIQCLPSVADMDRFQDLLPLMMETLTQALNCRQEETAQEALELLIELADTEPRFLRRQLVDVVGAMLQIAEATSLEDGTRQLAVEFVITLAEARDSAPRMMRNLPHFIQRLFAILMTMLLDIGDDPAWHTADSDEEDGGEITNYNFGQQCLYRLSLCMGGNTIVPVASKIFPAYLAAPEWQKRHATLMALAQIADGCSKVIIKNLEQSVTMVLKSFHDDHPRVRWAAINAIRQLSADLGPDLQVQFHHVVLPALGRAMEDFQNPRVQAHAASAVLHYISGACVEICGTTTPDIWIPYLDDIVAKLLVLLQNGKQMVQEGALTALASVAGSSNMFQKYYEAVIPYLKAILINANDKSTRMLRAKSMECITLVGMAVGKDMFRDDAKQVMEILMSLQGSQMEADDLTTSYMLEAWVCLCKCLGQDFLPYMSVVIPPLLQSAQLKPDVIITPADPNAYVNESDDDSIETITIRDKRFGMKTSMLEEKATACRMLACYANELKEGFFPWIDQVATSLVPLLKFCFHEEVRKAAATAMPKLLCSAKSAILMGQSQGRNESYIKQLSDYILPALVEALHKEPETEICVLDALSECIQISGPILDESQVGSIVEEIKLVMTASSFRRKEREDRATADGFDAEEEQFLKEENEQEEELIDQIGDCLGTLIKTFKASFLPLFDQLLPYITPMWGKDRSAEERRTAICIFDDIAEHCQESALKYYDMYLPLLLEACHDESPDVRQVAAYGIGICAEFGGSVFQPLVGEALSRLNVVISHPNALHPDSIIAYDNAVSALGKICQFYRSSINGARVVPAWLGCLPIKNDLVEAKVVHEQLCAMVERSDTDLIGDQNQNLPKIVTVFAEVILAGKDLATEQTIRRMINVLRRVQQRLPPAILASTFSALQPHQQHALQVILSS